VLGLSTALVPSPPIVPHASLVGEWAFAADKGGPDKGGSDKGGPDKGGADLGAGGNGGSDRTNAATLDDAMDVRSAG
jgi:hypothetical protein